MSNALSVPDQPLSTPAAVNGEGPSGWSGQASLYDITV